MVVTAPLMTVALGDKRIQTEVLCSSCEEEGESERERPELVNDGKSTAVRRRRPASDGDQGSRKQKPTAAQPNPKP